jgi:hypothetical protein
MCAPEISPLTQPLPERDMEQRSLGRGEEIRAGALGNFIGAAMRPPPLPVESMAWGMSSSGNRSEAKIDEVKGWVRGQLKTSRAQLGVPAGESAPFPLQTLEGS